MYFILALVFVPLDLRLVFESQNYKSQDHLNYYGSVHHDAHSNFDLRVCCGFEEDQGEVLHLWCTGRIIGYFLLILNPWPTIVKNKARSMVLIKCGLIIGYDKTITWQSHIKVLTWKHHWFVNNTFQICSDSVLQTRSDPNGHFFPKKQITLWAFIHTESWATGPAWIFHKYKSLLKIPKKERKKEIIVGLLPLDDGPTLS